MLSLFSKHQVLKSRFGTKVDQICNVLVAVILFSIFIVTYYYNKSTCDYQDRKSFFKQKICNSFFCIDNMFRKL